MRKQTKLNEQARHKQTKNACLRYVDGGVGGIGGGCLNMITTWLPSWGDLLHVHLFQK